MIYCSQRQYQKTKYRIPAQGKYILRCKWLLHIYLYHLWHLCCLAGSGRVFIKDDIFSLIIHVEKLIKRPQNSFLKSSMNIVRFYVYNCLAKHTLNLTMFTSQKFLKVCLTIFSMLRMNKLLNRYYRNTLPRVFYTNDVIKASQRS